MASNARPPLENFTSIRIPDDDEPSEAGFFDALPPEIIEQIGAYLYNDPDNELWSCHANFLCLVSQIYLFH